MEYYKKLYFVKRKHFNVVSGVRIHNDSSDTNLLEYDNIPNVGFKVVSTGLIDPVSGFIFRPENYWLFKEAAIARNFIVNGVCVEPLIFEYLKKGAFNVHFYNDVVNDVDDVTVTDGTKISLNETRYGTILRGINDENYYIYFGSVAQYYVAYNEKDSVKKKHLLLKLESYDEKTGLCSRHFVYRNFTSNNDKIYLKIKDIPLNDLRVKRYIFDSNTINFGEYIKNGVFDVRKFYKYHSSFFTTNTIRTIFSEKEILSKNRVRLDYEFVGNSLLRWETSLEYDSFDANAQTFAGFKMFSNILNDDNTMDFKKYNYAIKYNDVFYLMTVRRLDELHCYSPHFRKHLSDSTMNAQLLFYKMNSKTVTGSYEYFFNTNSKPKPVFEIEFDKPFEIYRVSYILNENQKFNIFENHSELYPMTRSNELLVSDTEIFEAYKNKKTIVRVIE